jgi:ceramide glucosyltransferase
MSIINHIAASIFAVCVIIHFLSVALALPRVRSPQKGVRVEVRPSVTLVRPVCGLEPFSRQTLDATFDLDWPDYEIIFCVDDPGDPVAALVRELIDARPGRNATLLCGLERVSGNPKLDNMAKGWRAARHDWIVFVDSNVLPPIDYLHRLFLACDGDGDGGMVSAPPAGAEPIGFWSEVECALLNATQARFQYAADSLGFGFAQGKTLFFNRKTLENGGFEALGREPAEDAAATRLVRGNGGKVHLADPPFPQLLGR